MVFFFKNHKFDALFLKLTALFYDIEKTEYAVFQLKIAKILLQKNSFFLFFLKINFKYIENLITITKSTQDRKSGRDFFCFFRKGLKGLLTLLCPFDTFGLRIVSPG